VAVSALIACVAFVAVSALLACVAFVAVSALLAWVAVVALAACLTDNEPASRRTILLAIFMSVLLSPPPLRTRSRHRQQLGTRRASRWLTSTSTGVDATSVV
jgi:hypothetical protein